MLQGLVNQIKSAAASFVAQYLARASVAIPFIVAFGFATAALGLELTARFGAKNAFWLMAAGFCMLGAIAALVVTTWERDAAEAEEQAEDSGLADLGGMATEATQVASRLPLGLLAPLLASASPSATATAAGRLLLRNIPLVLLLGFIVLLFWPSEEDTSGKERESGAEAPDEQQAAPAAQDPWREAA